MRSRCARPGIVCFALLVLCVSWPRQAMSATPRVQAPGADSLAVHEALQTFLTAFQNLEWERFRTCFSDDACIFYPSAVTPEEFCGRFAVERRWQQEFASIRRDSPAGPPYMHLRPDSLRIVLLGGTGALVTFELHNALRVGRRTFVFRREGDAWRIVHLHASNVPWPDESK